MIQHRVILLVLLLASSCIRDCSAFFQNNPTHYAPTVQSYALAAVPVKQQQQQQKNPYNSKKSQTNPSKSSTKIKSQRQPPKNNQQQTNEDQSIQNHYRRQQRQQQQQVQPLTNRQPWKASYHVSKETQEKIQQAAQDPRGTRRTPMERATAVLQTFLNMPPERCNSANLVCALTLSAKVIGQQTHHGNASSVKEKEQFRTLLFQVLDILHELVVNHEALQPRQLCNAIWAVAKHYDRDSLLLPLAPQMAKLVVTTDQFGLAETWDLNDDVDGLDLSPAERVDATVQAIAQQITKVLRNEAKAMTKAQDADSTEENNNNINNNGEQPTRQRETKMGEICMASWAFGVLRPRRRPPGWLAPPQMGRLNEEKAAEETKQNNNNNFITFAQWTTNDNTEDLSFINPTPVKASEPEDAADALFDAMAEALCRPMVPGDFTNPSMYDPPFDRMRIRDCTWSEIANVAWAFEKRARCQSSESEMLLRSLSREASRRLFEGGRETRYMLSRDISQLIWALGALQQDNFRLAHDLVDLVDDYSEYLGLDSKHPDPRPFVQWSCPDIVQMILSLAHARIDESGLLRALFEEAYLRLMEDGIATASRSQNGRQTFLAWEVSVMLWAQARLYLTSAIHEMFGYFTQTALKSIQSTLSEGSGLGDIGIGPQEQANIAWALTVLEAHQSSEAVSLLRTVFLDAASACKKDGLIQLEHAHQLWQALYLLEEESPAVASKVPSWFQDYLSEKWDVEKSRKKISSARHKSLSQVLDLMGVAHFNEHDEDIDVAIVLKPQASWTHQTVEGDISNAKKVAVEFDGPNHFTRKKVYQDGRPPKSVRALGHTVLKYRLLRKAGWTVVRVPYYEFDKIPFWASMERQRYLQRLLKTHADIKFSEVDVSEYTPQPSNRKTRFD